jgi:hypothetical protein
MTEDELVARVAELEAAGFVLVQEGRIIAPPGHGLTFSERAEGFQISLLGAHRPPDYRSAWENSLLDTDRRWVHLRRDRS